MHGFLDGIGRVEADVSLIEPEWILDAVHHVADADDAGERDGVEVFAHRMKWYPESRIVGRWTGRGSALIKSDQTGRGSARITRVRSTRMIVGPSPVVCIWRYDASRQYPKDST